MNTKDTLLSGFLTIVVVPLTFLNIFAGIIGGIWLLFSGGWSIILLAIIVGIVGTFVAALAMMPGMIGVPIIMWSIKHSSRVGLVFGAFLSSLLTGFAIYYVTYYLYSIIVTNIGDLPKVAIALLAYSVAMGPWQYMASKERSSSDSLDGASIATFFISLGLAVTTVVFAFSNTAFDLAANWLLLSMTAYVITATWIATRIKADDMGYSEVQEEEAPMYIYETEPDDISIPDELGATYSSAVKIALRTGKVSNSLLVRKLEITQKQAAEIIEALEENGVIGPVDAHHLHDVLISETI